MSTTEPVSKEQVDTLYERLQRIQEPKGYYFNSDTSFVKELLEQLLLLKQEYGYMPCPCRLANGTLEADKDIVCPCVYREEDVQEYGACYCGLYVSLDRKEGKIPELTVPERRPPEKILW